MRVYKATIAACGLLLAAGASAGKGHFTASVSIGCGYAPVYYGPCGYGFALYAPACGPLGYGHGGVFSPYTRSAYRYAGYGYRSYGYRAVLPRSYYYAHRGYDRYAYDYGRYHYPGRHYAYSYGYRFYDAHPHATFVIHGGHIRDYGRRGSLYYGHAYRHHRGRTLRHHVVQHRHVFSHGHHR